jgi:dolichol-phosphate mannosyltransferase
MSTAAFIDNSEAIERHRHSDFDFETYQPIGRSNRSIQANRKPKIKTSLSFVIPVMNEEATLEELTDGILKNVEDIENVEVIFVDDGSTDDSWSKIQGLAELFPKQVRGLRFRSNRGKAAALQVGFEAAKGDIIFTMDADLQDDPAEIPRFLEKLEEGYDLVSGWKAVRHDPWHKVLPSRVFNRMLSRFSRVKLHDHNCGFKCYRRQVAKSIQLFGELHRMVPSLAGMQGFKVTEIVVEHHERKFGVSKYGIERFIRGFSDMLTMGFLRVYRERPSHFANACCFGYCCVALVCAVAGLIFGLGSVEGIVCLLASVCLVGMGFGCVIAGLFSELMIRQNKSPAARDHVVSDTVTL